MWKDDLCKAQWHEETVGINKLLELSRKTHTPRRSRLMMYNERTKKNPLLKETPFLNSWKFPQCSALHKLLPLPGIVSSQHRQLQRSNRHQSDAAFEYTPCLGNAKALTFKSKSCRLPENVSKRGGCLDPIVNTVTEKASKTGGSLDPAVAITVSETASKRSTLKRTSKNLKNTNKIENYDFKHHNQSESPMELYRKQITGKGTKSHENKTTKTPYCCPVIKCRARPQKPVFKPNFVCFNFNLDEQNGMRKEFGCLKVRPVNKYYTCVKNGRSVVKLLNNNKKSKW